MNKTIEEFRPKPECLARIPPKDAVAMAEDTKTLAAEFIPDPVKRAQQVADADKTIAEIERGKR